MSGKGIRTTWIWTERMLQVSTAVFFAALRSAGGGRRVVVFALLRWAEGSTTRVHAC
jgi:ATP:corrinoid adenosyltransferase